MNAVDTIRAIATYLIAFVVVVGGGAIIYSTRADPSATDVVAIVAGFVGSALTFVFGSEVQTRTARQAAASTYAAGVVNGTAARNEAKASESGQ
jgi:membrane protein DedA with SNARE-associated domain